MTPRHGSRPSRALALAALFSLVGSLASGCGKSDDKPEGAPSGERTKEPEPETPKDAPSGPFAGFDFDAAAKAWQGAWVLEGDVIGKQVAWLVEGESLTEFDGTSERTLEFSIYSPCQVASTDAAEGVTVYKSFVFAGDVLHAGLGSSGVALDDAVIACTGGKVYVLRGDTCEEWSEMFDDWKSSPVTCTVEGEGEARKLVIEGKTELPFIAAGALATDQLKANVATKHADFAAAKAALAPAPAEDGAAPAEDGAAPAP